VTSNECGFGLGCHKNKCVKYGSLKIGTLITPSLDGEMGAYLKDEFLCESYYARKVSESEP
jgi:hypothetical protein